MEHTRRHAGHSRIEHRTDPEATRRIAATVVEAIAKALRLERDPVAPRSRRPVEEPEPALQRDEEPPRGGGERQGARPSRHRTLLVEAGRRVEAVDRPAVDVDPVEPGVIGTPDRALTQLRPRREDARRLEVAQGPLAHAGAPARLLR